MHKLLITGCRGQLGSELQAIADDYESIDFLSQITTNWTSPTAKRYVTISKNTK